MIARFHYDDKTFESWLRNEPTIDHNEVVKHVENCEHCQARLETICQAGLTWEEAGELLRANPLDDSVGSSPDTLDSRAGRTFLHPSEHPQSLGRFGRYEIMEFLGRGGMGIVMRGFDPALNRYSAIKVLAPELATSAAARKRFSREAKCAAAVVHQHVVPIQTVDEHDGIPYLVMPVVEGKSLQQRVDQAGPLAVVEAVRIAAQIAEGLAAAHSQGLVHRDIKPANILLENGVERVQITDFGLARAADDASMTRSGVIAGTPQYMSPEQAHGDIIDHRSDLFSLGSVMYFMLTGRSPFRAETTMGVLNRIANDEPRDLQSVNPDVSPALAAIVTKLLAKSMSDRFQSAEAVATLLRHYLAHLQQPNVGAAEWTQSLIEPKEQTVGLVESISGDESKLADALANSGRSRARIFTLLASLGAFGIFLFGIFVLQTKGGTIRIETNETLKKPIPIVIKQGDHVVKRLTVDNDGTTTRVRAGSYSVEFDGENTSFELKNHRAVIKADGVWVTRIEYAPGDAKTATFTESPTAIREMALADIQQGRYEDALNRIVWYWDNAVTIEPALSAVRRSFLLADWLALGEAYPPALAKLKSTRDDLETRILSKDQIRVRSDDFADFAAINQTLRQNERTNQTFEELKKRDPEDAARVRFWLPEFMQSPAPGPSSPVNPNDANTSGTGSDASKPAGDHTLAELAIKDAISQFNQRMNTETKDFDQPALTEQEILAFALWKLRTDKTLTEEAKALFSAIAIERRLPMDCAIEGGFTIFPPTKPTVNVFQILLVDRRRDTTEVVRRRYLTTIAPIDKPTAIPQPNGTPLAAEITEFNAIHNSVGGKPQPPLTVNEVLAAINHWQFRRDDAPVDNTTFEAFLRIAKTQELPDGVRFEVIPNFGTMDGDNFQIWSVRLVLPQIAKPDWTFAFEIREQYISVDTIDSTPIDWGAPSQNGLQAGVRLLPSQHDYKIGQKIGVQFFLRSITGKAIEVSLPNAFTYHSINVTDGDGNEVQSVEHQERVIGGWIETHVNEQPTLKVAQSISLADSSFSVKDDATKATHDSNVGATIFVSRGQTYRLRFQISNFAANDESLLNTGEVEFRVIGE